ncbi:MAG TPA: SCO6880 family protein [Solirubrobacteraceae bacterium]|nr:SCO6880 family protein [Solirubrobacteraceae bacterium]
MTSERLTYTFGPIEQRGLFGPLRAGQIAWLSGGAVIAIVILNQWPTAGGAVLGTVSFALATALAVWPIGRRSVHEWMPVTISYLARRAIRRTRFRSQAPASGSRSRGLGSEHPVIVPLQPHPPRGLRGLRITEVPYRGRPVGIVASRGERRLTAILACRVIAFSLLDADAQERRLARWSLVLSGAAGTSVRRIQWVERTAPAQGDELARWLATERDPAVPLRGTPMIESYLELISTTSRVSQDHEILLAVELDARRVPERGRAAATVTLLEQTERIAQSLEAAEVRVLGALTGPQVARALRTAFDPYARAELTALEAADAEHEGLAEAGAWPLGAEETWEHYRTDGAVHATFWIGGWPRAGVSPMFMDALLGSSGAVRTVAVTFEPLPIERSTREVEAAITRDQADRELRHRLGQSETARQRQAQDAAVRRESELAAGHGEVRLAGFVTVSGRDADDLRRACSQVHDQAARARLELHRMYGQQAEAFTFTLPLCRGLR